MYLSFNRITEIPDVMCNLINLQRLSLYNNQITELPDTMRCLINLQELYLDDNPIYELHKDKTAEEIVQYYKHRILRKQSVLYFHRILNCPYPILIDLYDSWNIE